MSPRVGPRRRASAVRRGIIAGALGCLLVAVPACSSHPPDPSAPYFSAASAVPGVTADADLVSASGTGAGALPAKGPVSRPNSTVTPGAAATTDVTAVCHQPKHVRHAVPFALQQAVFARYHISAAQAHHYAIDYLIPLELGGSTTVANLWPAAVRGNGYHEKQQLTQRLRTLVCRGSLTLTRAQSGVASDWFAMWLAYAGA